MSRVTASAAGVKSRRDRKSKRTIVTRMTKINPCRPMNSAGCGNLEKTFCYEFPAESYVPELNSFENALYCYGYTNGDGLGGGAPDPTMWGNPKQHAYPE